MTQDLTLNERTRVELGLVITLVSAILAALIAGTVWCTKISIGQAQLSKEVAALHGLVQSGVDDRWRRADMKAWIERANREAELWSKDAERHLNLEPGSWTRFIFPEVDK